MRTRIPPHNLLVPDLSVTRGSRREYSRRHPGPDDLLLLVEVSNNTLRFDRSTRARLYARAGVGEYWILDLVGLQLLVHRRPESGDYQEVTAYGPEEAVSTLARPENVVRVREFLPSPEKSHE